MSEAVELLPAGVDVPFGEIEPAQIRLGGTDPEHASHALIATVVVVATRDRLADAIEALETLAEPVGVRSILISHGDAATPRVRVSPRMVLVEGLKPDHLNNAVAALRLSSLPTLVWWRGGSPDALSGLAGLADRLVLDVADPLEVWPLVPELDQHTAVTDLRWTMLTRWRALTAHFFDSPGVCRAASAFHRLEIRAGDRHAARLYAAWLQSSLEWPHGLAVDIRDVADGAAIESVRLGDGACVLSLALGPSRQCIVSGVDLADNACASSVVSMGDPRLSALIAEELRVRSHDAAFLRAIRALEGMK